MDDAAAGAPCAGARTGAGHPCLARLVQGTVCKLLGQEEIKPHKVRYYLERPGKEPVTTPEAKAWLVSSACDKGGVC